MHKKLALSMLLLRKRRLFSQVHRSFSERVRLPVRRSPLLILKGLEIAWVTDLIRD